jgi:tRNA A-37 threonylcarbamoyl transferase component Bud32
MFEVKELRTKDITNFLNIKTDSLMTKRCHIVLSLYCSSEEDCQKKFSVKDQSIGEESASGLVYNSCIEDDCSYVAKWMPRKTNSFSNVIKEVKVQYDAYKAGIAPKIYQLLLCKKGALVIMDKLDKTAKELIMEYKTSKEKCNILNDVFRALKTLHKIGYVHNDAHLRNFMTDSQGNMKIIDFGSTLPYHDWSKWIDYQRIKDIITEGDYGQELVDCVLFNIELKHKSLKREWKRVKREWEQKWNSEDQVLDAYHYLEKARNEYNRIASLQNGDDDDEKEYEQNKEKLFDLMYEKEDLRERFIDEIEKETGKIITDRDYWDEDEYWRDI